MEWCSYIYSAYKKEIRLSKILHFFTCIFGVGIYVISIMQEIIWVLLKHKIRYFILLVYP